MKIALSLSGGGYRAAAFDLGTLYYLHTLSIEDKTLLERVKVLSTVSGGTFTGVKYASCIQKGQGIKECFKELYHLMANFDLVDEALQKLSKKKWKNKENNPNLINAFAEIYHDHFFHQERMGLFWQSGGHHIEEIIFNSTEFYKGLPFRFQKTKNDEGYIGNYYIRIPVEAAKEIRLADIVAASSCFPAGFEPIAFPNDFLDKNSPHLQKLADGKVEQKEKIKYPFGLMDGGIVDNQGIQSVCLAEERMLRSEKKEDGEHAIDLFIISDVASPYMDPYKIPETKKAKWWQKLSFAGLKIIGTLLLLACAGIIGFFLINLNEYPPLAIVLSSVLVTILVIVGTISLLSGNLLLHKFPVWFMIPPFFMKPLKYFFKIHFGEYSTMIGTRKDSILTMVEDVFLKQVRRLAYEKIYGKNSGWENRRITNLVYELREKEVNKRQGKRGEQLSPTLLEPDKKISAVAKKAASMGTTLWFTDEEVEGDENYLDSLIACGQFTICFNLLEYVELLKKPPLENPNADPAWSNLDNARRQWLDKLHIKALKDWKKFNSDPFWMLKDAKKLTGVKIEPRPGWGK